jgi:hypothetical protein
MVRKKFTQRLHMRITGTLRAATPLMVALAPEKMGLTEEQAKTAMHANAAGVDEALWMKVLARERG